MQIQTAPTSRTIPLQAGHRGTAQTIAAMRPLIDQGIKDQNINRFAIQLVWNTPEFSEIPKAQAIFNWMQQNLRFITDMQGKETLRTPQETLAVRAGDCDCFTILAVTLCGTIGLPGRAVTISTDPSDPNSYSHVYPEVFADGQWIAMDRGRPNSAFGLQPQNYFLKKTWPLTGDGSNGDAGVSGLSGYTLRCASMGRGRLGRAGMGDDTTDAANAAILINSISSGVAQGINASNGIPPGYTINAYGQLVPLTAAGAVPLTSGFSSGTLMLLLLVGGAALLLSRR